MSDKYESFKKLQENEADILEVNINERTIFHRFAVYLEAFFKG